MSRWFIALVCVSVAAGCGGDPESSETPSPPEPSALPPSESPVARTVIEGMVLKMHDSSPTLGARRNPIFTVKAAFLTAEADNTYTAEGGIQARAEREGEDPVLFKAEEGSIDQDNQEADLRGDVELRAGNILMKLADVSWDNKTGTARSERELTFGDGSADLSADGMEINTVNKTYALKNPSGRIRLNQQGDSQ